MWKQRDLPALGFRVWALEKAKPSKDNSPEEPGRIVTRVRMTGFSLGSAFKAAAAGRESDLKAIEETVPIYNLRSLTGHGKNWTPESMKIRAVCAHTPALYDANGELVGGHPAPDVDCGCGYYAVHDLNYLREAWNNHALQVCDCHVTAAVAGYGNVVQHSHYGFRSEWLKIIGFLDRGSVVPNSLVAQTPTKDQEDRVGYAVGEQFGLPVYPLNGLLSVMKEYGAFLPHTRTTWEATCSLCSYAADNLDLCANHLTTVHGIAVDANGYRNGRAKTTKITDEQTGYEWVIAGTEIVVMTAVQTIEEVQP